MVRGLGRGDAGRPTTCEFRRFALSPVEMLRPRVAATFDARDRWADEPDAIPPVCSGTWRLSEGEGPPRGARFTALDPAEDPASFSAVPSVLSSIMDASSPSSDGVSSFLTTGVGHR